MSEPQGPDSASFRAWEDATIAAEKAHDAWCGEWLETVSAIGKWMEVTIKAAPDSVPSPEMAFDDILAFVPTDALWSDALWSDESQADDWAIDVIYDHSPSMKAFHQPTKKGGA